MVENKKKKKNNNNNLDQKMGHVMLLQSNG